MSHDKFNVYRVQSVDKLPEKEVIKRMDGLFDVFLRTNYTEVTNDEGSYWLADEIQFTQDDNTVDSENVWNSVQSLSLDERVTNLEKSNDEVFSAIVELGDIIGELNI